jgi:hypothetical protein
MGYETTDLIQITPLDYSGRDENALKEALKNLSAPKQYVIIPNPEELKDTKEDEAITFTRGWDFRTDPQSLVYPNDRILPKLLLELQRLNKKGGVPALINEDMNLLNPIQNRMEQKYNSTDIMNDDFLDTVNGKRPETPKFDFGFNERFAIAPASPRTSHKLKQVKLNDEIITGAELNHINTMNAQNPKFNTIPRSSVIYNERRGKNKRRSLYKGLNLTPKSSEKKQREEQDKATKQQLKELANKTKGIADRLRSQNRRLSRIINAPDPTTDFIDNL